MPNCQLLYKIELYLKRALTGWGTGGFCLKTSAPLSLMMTYRMSLILNGSILLDSTFKQDILDVTHSSEVITELLSLNALSRVQGNNLNEKLVIEIMIKESQKRPDSGTMEQIPKPCESGC